MSKKQGAGSFHRKIVKFSNGMVEVSQCRMPTLDRSEPRAPKEKSSSDRQFRKNVDKAAKNLYYKLMENFRPGDYNLVFTYKPEDNVDEERARGIIKRFTRLYRDYCRKVHKCKAKYIYNTEVGRKSGRAHHHVILRNYRNLEDIEELWRRAGGGSVQYRGESKLWSNYDWYGLAEYIVGIKDGAYPDREKWESGRRRYVCSKGLRMPEIEYKRMKRWTQSKAPKGWEIVPGSLRDGMDEERGCLFQKFLLRRLI